MKAKEIISCTAYHHMINGGIVVSLMMLSESVIYYRHKSV